MLRNVTTVLAALLIAIAPSARAQSSRPQFAVATIKPTDPSFRGNLIGAPGGILSARGYTLKALIAYSYDMDERQILDIPKSLDGERYDITAKPEKEGRFTPAEGKLMLQSLLADRFQLKFHRETRELLLYILTVAKSGSKMRPRTEGDGGAPRSMLFQGPRLPGRNLSVTDLAAGLQKMALDRPVIDKTGLTGKFDFDLTWRPELQQVGGQGGTAISNADVPDIFTALQEQLGLKLESSKGPVEVLVIDSVSRPTEN
jgi:uncharacterized protein (TIGR03435 family)